MAYSWNGKVVLVTGAASGIGAAVVRHLLTEDVKHVVMLDISEDGVALKNELDLKCEESKVTFLKCDVTDEARLIECFKIVKDQNGTIDVVINSAGIFNDALDSFATAININVVALVTSSLQAWYIMHKEKGGSGGTIINFSSVAAIYKLITSPIYSATKSAVLKFSTCLGDQSHYSRSGVRVLCMCFGATDTPIIRGIDRVFDNAIKEQNVKDIQILGLQSAESAAKAVGDAYKTGASGSVWISVSNKPAVDVTEIHDKNIEMYNATIFSN